MKIRRLDITGFKSFCGHAVFQFDDGVTGIVGPNGCGKSNVVDAIRWVMGEQSAKHLRGRSMEDVIFAGSESRAAQGMAEVSITFASDGRNVPAQYQSFSEISVTRRLFRDGQSEYLINKTPVRMMDVNDLFLGTGVGKSAYSIIEQGRIGLIVSARPQDRRSIIEEAAGITKYQSRRKQAERKLEATSQNLLRVSDVVGEIEKRLEQLKRQAKKAEKYRAVRTEIKELDLAVSARRLLALRGAQSAARAAVEEARAQSAELAARVQALDEEIAGSRERAAADQRTLEGLGEEAHAVDKARGTHQTNVGHFGREREEIALRNQTAAEEIERLLVQREQLAVERERRVEQKAATLRTLAVEQAALQKCEKHLAQAQARTAGLQEAMETERQAAYAALALVGKHHAHQQALEKRQAELRERLERSRVQAGELHERRAGLERAHAEADQALGQKRQLKLNLLAEQGAQEEVLESARAELSQVETELVALREELTEKRSRLASLTAIARNYEGYGRGVRAVMKRQDPGVRGLVADVLAAEPEYEAAIEAVLGERLQHVIVDGHEKGIELCQALQREAEGRGSFVALSGIAAGAESATGAGVRALDVVRRAAEYEGVARMLLCNVWIVDDLPAAIELWKSEGRSATYVTRGGDVLDPHGVITGGTLEGAGAGLLHQKREIAELGERVAELETRFQVLQHRHQQLQARLAQIETGLKALSKDTHAQDLDLAKQEKDFSRYVEELERVTRDDAALTEAQAQIEHALEEWAREAKSLEHAVAAAEEERVKRDRRASELALELKESKDAFLAVGQDVTGRKVRCAADAQKHDSLTREAARAEEAARAVEERTGALQSTVQRDAERARELAALVAQAQEDLTRLAGEAERLRATLAEARAAYEAALAALRALEEDLRARRRGMDEANARLSHAELAEREAALEVSHLGSTVRDRYNVDLAAELDRAGSGPPDAEAEARLTELRGQVERMGEINLTAIEEAEELEQRYAFLTGQKKDLETTLTQLKDAILRINVASKERFEETFKLVDEKFREVFPRLFKGGRAGLVLTEATDGEEPGIEILAQPPGKKLQSVSLMSGGEKALTAVSLIFAIFLIKPTPFCLLDEVDAPLDDANVGRYNELVRQMCEQSQFILITHNKRTMEGADTLYGVTMEEPGCSKLVAVRLNQREQNAA